MPAPTPPDPDIPQNLRVQAFRQIEAAATNDPSAVVRQKCADAIAIMRCKERKQLLADKGAIARNTLLTDDVRCAAIDVILQLIRT